MMTTEDKDTTICALEKEVARLRNENKKLEDTVQWMHDLIWKMVKERETAPQASGIQEDSHATPQ